MDEDLTYAPTQLDRDVVAETKSARSSAPSATSCPRFSRRRTEVPKTLIFAKDDSHADDIVRIVREEFGKGNDFCKKITYRVSGKKPEDLILPSSATTTIRASPSRST